MKYVCNAPCGVRPCESNRPEREYFSCVQNRCPLGFAHEWLEKDVENEKD